MRFKCIILLLMHLQNFILAFSNQFYDKKLNWKVLFFIIYNSWRSQVSFFFLQFECNFTPALWLSFVSIFCCCFPYERFQGRITLILSTKRSSSLHVKIHAHLSGSDASIVFISSWRSRCQLIYLILICFPTFRFWLRYNL